MYHCTKMSSSAQVAVQNRYARWPIASPSAKYSNSASIVTNPTANATIAVDPHKTIPTANGISTAAVATRFQVIEKDSPDNSRSSSLHIARNKSRNRWFYPIETELFCHSERSEGSAFCERDQNDPNFSMSESTELSQRSRISL